MNSVLSALSGASVLLTSFGRSHAVVGGLAVSARSEPRFTRDVDIAVAVSDDTDAEALVSAFVGHGYRVLAIAEQEAAGRLATARLVPPGGNPAGVIVDLLFGSSGIEPEICQDAEPIPIVEGLTVPVARLGHLVALKVLSRDDERRPQDRVDLCALLEQADATELRRARDALQLITRRAFHRGRDLEASLDELLVP
jgi:predicted nucleotidyltransferase